MFAAEARGDLKPGTAREWAHKTKGMSKLPERVDEPKAEGKKEALAKFAIDLSWAQPGIEWAVNNLPHAPEHARQFIQAHPLAAVGGTGALAGYGGVQVGRAYQATKDLGKNLATGGMRIGRGAARGGQAVGLGIAQGARSLADVFRKKGALEAVYKYALDPSWLADEEMSSALAGAPLGITAGRRAWRHFHPDDQ